VEDAGEHYVAVISASLLRAVMTTYGENHHGFAARAGVAAKVAAEAAGGTCPAWTLPYDEFTAIADAVAALWPCAVFETAAACDLLLSCVLNGDHFMATDVLTDPCSQDLARALLRLAITSEPGNGIRAARDALLPADLLPHSKSPDAWVGAITAPVCRLLASTACCRWMWAPR
jgi:hypothetical protein